MISHQAPRRLEPDTAAHLGDCEPLEAELLRLRARVAELEGQINNPVINDWLEGVRLEAAHQRERWGSSHDGGKTPFDWFWLIGYLAQKAASSAVADDAEKAMHHTISTGAALLNWHRSMAGGDAQEQQA